MANLRKVRCKETGEVFSSIKEAANFYGVTSTTIYNSIRKGRACSQKAVKGLSFEYTEEREEGEEGIDKEKLESWRFFEERMKRILKK